MQKYITITVLLITTLSIQYAIVASSGVGEDPIIRKSNEKMSIDWNEASTSASGSYLPPGCKCVDTSDPCKFECNCDCDITSGHCDAGCCCDTDCYSSETKDFEELSNDGCSNQAETNPFMCYDSTSISANGEVYGMRQTNPLDGVMCVVMDNSPIKGTYYEYDSKPVPSPDQFPASKLSENAIRPEYSFGQLLSATNDEVTRTQYTVGDRIQAAVANAGEYSEEAADSAIPAFRGFWQLPTNGVDGRCSESNPILFREAVVDSNTCIQETTNINTACELRGFNARKYTSDLLIAKKHKSGLDPLQYVNIIPGIIKKLNSDGTYTEISGLVVNGTGVLPKTVYNTTTSICHNALVQAHYHVTYTPLTSGSLPGSGTISSITVDAVLMDISGTGAKVLEQEFLIDFVSDAAVASSSSNLPGYNTSRSGNPGYITGRPVLAGEYMTLPKDTETTGSVDKFAIAQYSGGLRFPLVINGDGTCKTSFSDTTIDFGEQILYGVDAKVGCSVSLDRGALETLCDESGVPSYFNVSFDTLRVGVYGNANPYKVDTKSSWLPFTPETVPSRIKFDGAYRVCPSLITGVEYEFLVAKVGNYKAPQEKIVAARIVYKTSTVSLDHAVNSKTNIYFTSSATFVMLEEGDGVPYVPAAPPLLPVLPYDVFYPFTQNRASSANSIYGSSRTALIVSILISFFCLFVNSN